MYLKIPPCYIVKCSGNFLEATLRELISADFGRKEAIRQNLKKNLIRKIGGVGVGVNFVVGYHGVKHGRIR